MAEFELNAGDADGRPREQASREELKARVHRRLVDTLDLVAAQRLPVHELRQECLRRLDQLLGEERVPFTTVEKQQLLREVMDDIFGLGPIEELLRDQTISDILINGPFQIYIEREGRLPATKAQFRDNEHLMRVIQRIASRIGRRVDESSPMLDARLADGSRVNVIVPPLALIGPVMSVRRFAAVAIDAKRLAEFGSWTDEMCTFMQAAVHSR